jgi:hypothetical protein
MICAESGMKSIVGFVVFAMAALGAAGGLRPAPLAAQDVVGFSLSFGPDSNYYNPERACIGVRFSGDYRFGEMLSVGSSALVASDFNEDTSETMEVFEFTGYVRYYLFRDGGNLIRLYTWHSLFHAFIQAEIGVAAFIVKVDNPGPIASLGLTGGVRIALGRFSPFYIEPSVRIGVPYTVGVCFLAVYRFPINGTHW